MPKNSCVTLYRKLRPTNVVLEQISLIARHLRNHRDLVSQLFENGHHVSHQGPLPFDGTQSSIPVEGAFGPVASAEHESSGCRDSPSTPTTIQHTSNDLSSQPVNKELNDPALPEGTIARNNLQPDGSWLRKNARPGFRLHTSDFIRSLSE